MCTPLSTAGPALDSGASTIQLGMDVKMLLEALMVEGQQHPEPGSLGPSLPPCSHSRLPSPSLVQKATCLANCRAESIEGPGPQSGLSSCQGALVLKNKLMRVGVSVVRQFRGIRFRVFTKYSDSSLSHSYIILIQTQLFLQMSKIIQTNKRRSCVLIQIYLNQILLFPYSPHFPGAQGTIDLNLLSIVSLLVCAFG